MWINPSEQLGLWAGYQHVDRLIVFDKVDLSTNPQTLSISYGTKSVLVYVHIR